MFGAFLALCLPKIGFISPNPANGGVLNIYVENGIPWGHVFIGIKEDGGSETRYGLRPKARGFGAAYGTEGYISDEAQTLYDSGCGFKLTPSQLASARAFAEKYKNATSIRYSAIVDHEMCGDFASRVVSAAGLPYSPPSYWVARNYPSQWRAYLKSLQNKCVPVSIRFTNGSYYNGQITNGVPDGFGHYEFNGEVYEGAFVNGSANGNGALMSRSSRIDTTFKNGVGCGPFKESTPSGWRFAGTYNASGKPDGKMTAEYQGQTFTATFANGQINSSGWQKPGGKAAGRPGNSGGNGRDHGDPGIGPDKFHPGDHGTAIFKDLSGKEIGRGDMNGMDLHVTIH